MSETIITNVTIVSKNEVSDTAKERLMQSNNYDTFEEYASSLERDVEAIVANKLFGDADEIPILDVNTEVE